MDGFHRGWFRIYGAPSSEIIIDEEGGLNGKTGNSMWNLIKTPLPSLRKRVISEIQIERHHVYAENLISSTFESLKAKGTYSEIETSPQYLQDCVDSCFYVKNSTLQYNGKTPYQIAFPQSPSQFPTMEEPLVVALTQSVLNSMICTGILPGRPNPNTDHEKYNRAWRGQCVCGLLLPPPFFYLAN